MDFSIYDLLMGWGRSKAIDDAYHLDFPHQSPYAVGMRNSGQWASKAPDLPEELHNRVDQEVSALKQRGDLRHKAITLAYIKGFRDVHISSALRVSRNRAKELRLAGESWLEARLIE